MPYSLYKLAYIFAACFFFIPTVLVVARNLLKNKLLLWFALYWFWAGLINVLCSIEIIQNALALSFIERIYNLLDTPVMLFIIYKTTEIEHIKKSLKKILMPLVGLEIFILIITKLNEDVETVLVFGGVLLILFYVIWTIVSYSRTISFRDFSFSHQYIYYGLLFEYATSIITVVCSYVMPHKYSNDDSFLIFHISTIITIATASAGILTYQGKKMNVKIKKRKMHEETEIRFL